MFAFRINDGVQILPIMSHHDNYDSVCKRAKKTYRSINLYFEEVAALICSGPYETIKHTVNLQSYF